MVTNLRGHTCVYCGMWVSPTDTHWCERMHPNWNPGWENITGLDPSAPGGPLDRIAGALERIAGALEARARIR
jgi:hypothetical protein